MSDVWFGYRGKIAIINLDDQSYKIENLDKNDVQKFIGALGINCKLATRFLKPKCEPLSPENVIILGTGPLVGTITPGASRLVGLTKFPASGAIANSCGSMSFAFFMKHAGFDHLVIIGKAEKPIFLEINNNSINFKSAKELWGQDIVKTNDKLKKEYGSCGIIAIGQAGERQIYSSLTLIDKISTFGRGGLGAVMGSKNLKAIVAKGSEGVSIANYKEFLELYKNLFQRIKNYPQRESWHQLGMLRSLPIGLLLTAKGQKKKAKQCTDRMYLKKMKKRRIACPSCPMGDKDILEIKEGDYSGLICYASSVINPLLMFLLDDLKTYQEMIKIFDEINRLGLDCLTMTTLMDACVNLVDKGLIPEKEFGFKPKKDFDSLKKVIELIIKKEGIGAILAEGWNKLAEAYIVRKELPIIKGLDVVFEPRFMRLGTMEFEQVVNPKGAHVASGGSPTYASSGGSEERFKTHFDRMGIPKSAFDRLFRPPIDKMRINVGRLTRYSEDWYSILTNLGLCARAQMNRFYSLKLVTSFYNSITGFKITPDEMRIAGERSWTLLKLLNAREGFSRKEDRFPDPWFKPLKYGENQLELKDFFGEIIITRELANKLLDDYYDERGWALETGLPSNQKLQELELSEFKNFKDKFI
ncbi:MAG: aldehyde ferredoxin oxidoreductase N-terminal domain-containing protein [Promethearchaeota archaeon]